MSDCLQPVAFTSLLMEPSGRLIQFSSRKEGGGLWETDPAAHISIRPRCLSVPLLRWGAREGKRGGYRREEVAEEEKEVGGRRRVTGKARLLLRPCTPALSTTLQRLVRCGVNMGMVRV